MKTFNPGDLVIAREESCSYYLDPKSGERLYYWRVSAGAVGKVIDDGTAPNLPNTYIVDFGVYEQRANWLSSRRAGVYAHVDSILPFSMEYAMNGGDS
jgi:hypothetical protein